MSTAERKDPPLVIRGSQSHRAPVYAALFPDGTSQISPSESAFPASFDWYQGTLFETPRNVVEMRVRERFPDATFTYPEKAGNAWHERVVVTAADGESQVCQILTGGNPGVHVVTSGAYSAPMAELLREWPFRVTRADSAIDFIREGIFDELHEQLRAFGLEHDLKLAKEGDWDRGRGRTYYLGSRRSGVMIRLYEKGHKEGGDPNWVRLEVEVKPPKKPAGFDLHYKEPHELFHACRWVSKLSEELLLPDAMRFAVGTVRTATDAEHRRLAMIEQYGRTMFEWVKAAGGKDPFFAELLGYVDAVHGAPTGDRHAQITRLRELGIG